MAVEQSVYGTLMRWREVEVWQPALTIINKLKCLLYIKIGYYGRSNRNFKFAG
jgi:hypothetical protein